VEDELFAGGRLIPSNRPNRPAIIGEMPDAKAMPNQQRVLTKSGSIIGAAQLESYDLAFCPEQRTFSPSRRHRISTHQSALNRRHLLFVDKTTEQC
jgi:hypothetical protein